MKTISRIYTITTENNNKITIVEDKQRAIETFKALKSEGHNAILTKTVIETSTFEYNECGDSIVWL